MEINKIYNGDCLEVLRTLPENSIDCCVTSPPYFGLRDYGVDGQIGLEQTPEMFVAKLNEVFEQVRRVLKPQGTLWLNIGDSYSSYRDSKSAPDTLKIGGGSELANKIEKGLCSNRNPKTLKAAGLKHKDLIGIPWLLAEYLRAGLFFCETCEQESSATIRLNDGRLICKCCGQVQLKDVETYSSWYLRQDIIWHKPNPMPESVTDRCTKAHEYIFLLSKSQKYYYAHDAIKVDSIESFKNDNRHINRVATKSTFGNRGGELNGLHSGNTYFETGKANKRSVWTVTTKPFSDAHFATFPEDLIVDCIKAGCPENGVVLDPFMGAGTTALVSQKLGRNFVGIELNPEYTAIAEKRLAKELGMFYKRA